MSTIRPFKALRPAEKLVEKVAELPYDVVNTEEAKAITGNNKHSFFHITKPEIDMPEGTNPYDEEVYKAGKKKLNQFRDDGILIQEDKPCLYLYTLTWQERSQTGIVAGVSVDDYYENRIKKHELTREDKEKDRTRHLDILNANTGPVFLLYKEDGAKTPLLEKAMENTLLYDFTADDSVRHTIRKIDSDELISKICDSFRKTDLYIADGHHRAASAAAVGRLRREEHKDYTGGEEFNYFLTVIFPHDQLAILSYNRAVKDLKDLEVSTLLDQAGKDFTIVKTGQREPDSIRKISMYLDKNWYTLTPKFSIPDDPIDSLDVKLLQDHLLGPILGIDDPRTSNRIDFIGGIRGTGELEKLVDSGSHKVAFSMYPTTVDQLISVSDSGGIMPPKSTWFEPKLRSGLFVHLLD